MGVAAGEAREGAVLALWGGGGAILCCEGAGEAAPAGVLVALLRGVKA